MLDNQRAVAWLNRFKAEDQPQAALLLTALKLVTADEFVMGINTLLEERFAAGGLPMALYNETERGQRGGVPHRLFKETRRKRRRAYGASGPSLVPRQRQIDEAVGSEGTLATILTQFAKAHGAQAVLSPGPDTIRDRKVRRAVLVTDFIGSGDRVYRYLQAAWRVRSVRSWWSRREDKGMSFDVLAFSGTEAGVARVKAHPSRPQVHIAQACPTIDSVFNRVTAANMRMLCTDYGPKGKDAHPLGYGDVGALIAFSHSMPNNAPAVFWQRYNGIEPLFPSRVTTGVSSPFHAASGSEAKRDRLLELSGLGTEATPRFTIDGVVLAALMQGPRSVQAVSGRLGLLLSEVAGSLATLNRLGLTDDRNVPTARGRLALERIKGRPASPFLPKSLETEYFPTALRVPRDI